MNESKIFDLIRNLYSRINYSRFMEKRGRAIVPLRYLFELTHRCNLSCPYCYVGDDKIEESDELDFIKWQNIISQIPSYAFITLVGGEPLVRKDFCDILYESSARVHGKVNVVTNGVLMDDKIISAFIKSKMLLLSISIDGWGENHDKYRNQKGIFKKIEENLDNLSERVRSESTNLMVDIKTIVMKDNLEDILKLYQYATNKGFDFFSISFLRNNNLKQNSNLRLAFGEEFYKTKYPIEEYFDLDEFERIYLEIQKIKKYSKTKIRFAPKFDNHDPKVELDLIKKFFREYNKYKVSEIYEPCLFPYSNTIINPKGDVYPCLSYKTGNLEEKSLKEIINSVNYCCFRKNLKYSKVFPSCQMCCELKVKNL